MNFVSIALHVVKQYIKTLAHNSTLTSSLYTPAQSCLRNSLNISAMPSRRKPGRHLGTNNGTIQGTRWTVNFWNICCQDHETSVKSMVISVVMCLLCILGH